MVAEVEDLMYEEPGQAASESEAPVEVKLNEQLLRCNRWREALENTLLQVSLQ